jgi:ABC-2 type transport system ATP-binding protein
MLSADAGTIRPNSGAWPTISYKPDRLIFPNHLRADAFLGMMCRLANIPGPIIDATVRDALGRVNLSNVANKKIGALSKGMRQRLGIAQAIIGDPKLLLLDEPSNGLDPNAQVEIGNLLKALRAEGRTIIMSSHQLPEVTKSCTHLVILNEGQVRYDGSMAEALAMRQAVMIATDRPIGRVWQLLRALHPDIEATENEVILKDDAVALRRQVMTMLLGAGYDIVGVERSQNTLADVYAEAVQS